MVDVRAWEQWERRMGFVEIVGWYDARMVGRQNGR